MVSRVVVVESAAASGHDEIRHTDIDPNRDTHPRTHTHVLQNELRRSSYDV